MSQPFQPNDYVQALKQQNVYASDRDQIYGWSGMHWAVISKRDSESHAYHWLVEKQPAFASARHASEAHKSAVLGLPALPTTTEQVIIPCKNGYVHVADDISFHPADPALGIRYVLDCDYEADEPPPGRFLKFLAQVLPNQEIRSRVQEYIGYTLLADARYQRAQFWLGDGANGKGVLANIVQALHGRVASINLDSLDGFGLSLLIGASLIFVDEVPRRGIHEERLKSLISADTMPVDRKYQDPISVKISGKWLALGNHIPSITDDSLGFWRRWDIVPFEVTIPEGERDPLLAETIIRNELSGVLAWALAGLVRLMRRGAFESRLPVPMQSLLTRAKALSNPVLAWIEDCDIEAPSSMETRKDDVYSHYYAWSKRNGMSPFDSSQFWTRFERIVPIREVRRRCQDGGQKRFVDVGLPTSDLVD